MNVEEIALKVRDCLPFRPLPIQEGLIMALAGFVSDDDPRGVFVLNGYAGTGKTSIVGALVKALESMKMKAVVLAPTGRAAKVAGGMAGGRSSTIHRRIYHPEGGGTPGGGNICLSPNRDKDTLFIVDEASLITGAPRGGGLLDDLVRHVYSAPGCRMLLVGDTAQLPPVGQEDSPAMKAERLKAIGLSPVSYTLDVPVRQGEGSGILYNATIVRHALFKALQPKPAAVPSIFTSGVFVNAPKLPPLPGIGAEANGGGEIEVPLLSTDEYADIDIVDGYELPDRLSTSWSEVGPEETLIITRSNKRANDYNMAIRNQVMYAEEPLQQGDRLVIAKNDYYWSAKNKLKTFIANGDIARVEWVGRLEKMYGRWFVDVELQLAQGGERVSAKLMLRSLSTEGPSISKAEMDRFFTHVMAEQEGGEHEKIMSALEDPYFNALQAKYAYCVTCHKAQGGQWSHVYIDMAGLRPEALDTSYLRWFYTALTRATSHVWLINPPQSMLEK